jgi:site-specific recombinase XerD
MNDLIIRFEEDLQLAGYAKRSCQSYISSVHRMQRFLQKPLEDITEEDLRQYWLACTSDFGWSAASLRVSYSGIKQFFTRTLVRSWPLLSEVRLKREEKLPTVLPCHYFLLTVTVPKALRRVIRSHQHAGYAALFSCAVATLTKLACDPRFLGSQRIGCLAVLHTWGS